jgi:hypothetical protein
MDWISFFLLADALYLKKSSVLGDPKSMSPTPTNVDENISDTSVDKQCWIVGCEYLTSSVYTNITERTRLYKVNILTATIN